MRGNEIVAYLQLPDVNLVKLVQISCRYHKPQIAHTSAAASWNLQSSPCIWYPHSIKCPKWLI